MSDRHDQDNSSIRGEKVYITIDDFPYQNGLHCRDLEEFSERIVKYLDETYSDRRSAKPVFFVNSDRLGNCQSFLPSLAKIGIVANHTASHVDVSECSANQWREDVLRCHDIIKGHVDTQSKYFRYPYLRTGQTQAIKSEAKAVLEGEGFVIIPGTCPTADWLYADYYDRAQADGNGDLCQSIAQACIDHIVDALLNARVERDNAPVGDAPLIIVLHFNNLLSVILAPLLTRLQEMGCDLEGPPLSGFSQFDPHDQYVGQWGGSYFLQTTETGRADLVAGRDWLSIECARISSQFACPSTDAVDLRQD